MRRRFLLILFLMIIPLSTIQGGDLQISYLLSTQDREDHYFKITMKVSGIKAPHIDLSLPAWNALYQIRDFAQYLQNFQAFDMKNNPLEFYKTDKQTWRVNTEGIPRIKVTYRVYANTLSPFNSYIGREHAFFNGAMLFLYLVGKRDVSVTLEFDIPLTWHVGTALIPTNDPRVFKAENYDHLVDCPVELGEFQRYGFRVKGIPFRVIVQGGKGQYNPEELVRLIRTIVEYQTGPLMGDIPFKDYTFIYHFTDHPSGGGMEHRNSTAISIGIDRIKEDIKNNAGVTAHEFFHVWNVKRIRPQAYIPLDYTKEVYTRSLWFCEGVTCYYTALTLVRTGIWSKEDFYNHVGRQIEILQSKPGRKIQSLEESSFHTWFDKYPWYRRPENSISYYNKGELVGFLLDLKIRDATDNRRSLDDVMRFMNWWFGKRGRGFQENEDILWTISSIAQYDFSDFFQSYIQGTKELPYDQYLKLAGLKLEIKRARTLTLGFSAKRSFGGPLIVDHISKESEAERAGLRLGDEIVSIDGEEPPWSLSEVLNKYKEGERVRIGVRRRGGVQQMEVRIKPSERVYYFIKEIENPTEKQLRIREGLLLGVTN